MTEDQLKTLARIPKDSILEVVIYTRTAPPCQFCNQAKSLMKSQLSGVLVKEIDISTGKGNEEEWSKLLQSDPSIRSVPQIFFHYDSDSEKKEVRIGGADNLIKLCKERNLLETV